MENKNRYIECGRIGRPIGLKGEMSVQWNNGGSPVGIGGELFFSNVKEYKPCVIAAFREQGRTSIVRFEGVDDRTSAEEMRGKIVFIPEDRLPKLPKMEYYSYQILGLDVWTVEGRPLGKVVKIFTAGENDVYEVKADEKDSREFLIPAIDSVIATIDLNLGRIVINPLDGML